MTRMKKHSGRWLARLASAAGLLGGGCALSGEVGPWGVSERRRFAEDVAELTAPEAAPANEFSLVLPVGAERAQFALVARERLQLGRGASVTEQRFNRSTWGAPVASLGEAVVGEDARVGSVYALGRTPLVIELGASVSGFVKARAGVQKSRGAFVNLGSIEHAPGSVEEFRWQVRPVGAKRSVLPASSSEPRVLQPGVYERLVVAPHDVVSLRAGRYFVDELELQPGGTLSFDNGSGPVYVWVQARLDIRGKLTRAAEEHNVLWGYAGSEPPRLESAFVGALIAPRADVTVPASAEPHRASFFARSIAVADGAAIEHWGFFVGAAP
jgi:hypothetical protein